MNTKEQTRVREQGTKVTNPQDGIERINAVRQIVTDYQYAKLTALCLTYTAHPQLSKCTII